MKYRLVNIDRNEKSIKIYYQYKNSDSIPSFEMTYTYKIYYLADEYKICKELINTRNKTLALLNINHKCLGIALVARKILDI
jgi:hypothetical protein